MRLDAYLSGSKTCSRTSTSRRSIQTTPRFTAERLAEGSGMTEKHPYPWSLSPINSPLSHPQGLRVYLQVPEEYRLFGNDYSLVDAYRATYRQRFKTIPRFPFPPLSPLPTIPSRPLATSLGSTQGYRRERGQGWEGKLGCKARYGSTGLWSLPKRRFYSVT